MAKPRVREVILVEGRYDQTTLAQVVDGLILPTGGFQIFQDREKAALFRRLAQERGVVILTDSDGAGRLIRSHLKGILPPSGVKEAFIPDRPGKERRKRAPGRAGLLGVEGMAPEVLLTALRRAGVTFEDPPAGEGETGEKGGKAGGFTKAVLYQLGLSGTAGAAQRRQALQRALDLPANLSANALLGLLNVLTTPEEVARLLDGAGGEEGKA